MPKPNPVRQMDNHAPDLTPPTPMPWMDRALCAQVGDPGLWFGEAVSFVTDDAGQRESAAKAVCSRCPVAAECLAFGLDERYGIWGGKTPAERWRMKRSAS